MFRVVSRAHRPLSPSDALWPGQGPISAPVNMGPAAAASEPMPLQTVGKRCHQQVDFLVVPFCHYTLLEHAALLQRTIHAYVSRLPHGLGVRV